MQSDDELDERIAYFKKLIYQTYERYKEVCLTECEPYDLEILRLERMKSCIVLQSNTPAIE